MHLLPPFSRQKSHQVCKDWALIAVWRMVAPAQELPFQTFKINPCQLLASRGAQTLKALKPPHLSTLFSLISLLKSQAAVYYLLNASFYVCVHASQVAQKANAFVLARLSGFWGLGQVNGEVRFLPWHRRSRHSKKMGSRISGCDCRSRGGLACAAPCLPTLP